jgi:hypothetical protein
VDWQLVTGKYPFVTDRSTSDIVFAHSNLKTSFVTCGKQGNYCNVFHTKVAQTGPISMTVSVAKPTIQLYPLLSFSNRWPFCIARKKHSITESFRGTR